METAGATGSGACAVASVGETAGGVNNAVCTRLGGTAVVARAGAALDLSGNTFGCATASASSMGSDCVSSATRDGKEKTWVCGRACSSVDGAGRAVGEAAAAPEAADCECAKGGGETGGGTCEEAPTGEEVRIAPEAPKTASGRRLRGSPAIEATRGCAQSGAKRAQRHGGRDSCRLWREESSKGLRSRGRHRGIQRNVRRDHRRSSDLSRGCGLKQHGSVRLEIECSLNAGFDASGHENSFKSAVSEPGGIGVERVFAGNERGEAKGSVSGRCGPNFSAGGLVPQKYGDASQWRRAQVSEAACERTGLGRLNLDEVLRQGTCGIRLGEDQRVGAQAKRSQHQPSNPVPPCVCHCRRCSGRSWEKGQMSKPVRS